MKNNVTVFRSQTWVTATQDELNFILNEMLSPDDDVINIQVLVDDFGSSRFWIYVKGDV
jgi:hypothetical protein